VTTPGLAERIIGVILYDETIRQQEKDGTPFVKVITDAGITPGISVDSGTEEMNTTTSIAKLKKSAT
jgi:fructose-bisphosphate aldolase class I